MKIKRLKSSATILRIAIITLATLVLKVSSTGIKALGSFCQSSGDCQSGCCHDFSCSDEHVCTIMDQVTQFEKYYYCTLDSDCEETGCCYDQQCQTKLTCFTWYYAPLLIAIVAGIVIAVLSTLLIQVCINKQKEKFLKERKDEKRLEKKNANSEKRKLLDESSVQDESSSRNDTSKSDEKNGEKSPDKSPDINNKSGLFKSPDAKSAPTLPVQVQP